MTEPLTRTLLGSVGYYNLRDLSVGPLIVETLEKEGLPENIDVCDLSYGGPIATVHRLNETKPPYERVIFVGAIDRGPGAPGYRWYRFSGALPLEDEIQARVAEAVTGVLDLDSFPIIAKRFGALPDDVLVVEVDPVETDAGLEPSDAVKALLPDVCRIVRRLASE